MTQGLFGMELPLIALRLASEAFGSASPRHPQRVLGQASYRVPIVNMMGSVGGIMPGNGFGQTQSAIDRGGHVFRRLWTGGRKGGVLIRRANDRAASDASAGEEDCLHGSPVIAAGQLDPRNIQR